MGTPTTKDTTKYIYFMSNGHSYENPDKKDFQYFEDTYGDTTEQEIIDRCNSYNGLTYFIGTQSEYDVLKTITETYHDIRDRGYSTISFTGIDHLVDGKVVFDDSNYLTQARWDEVNVLNYFYYKIDEIAMFETWIWLDYLNGNQNGTAPKFTDLVTDPNAIEIAKVEYETLKATNETDTNKERTRIQLQQDNVFLSKAKVAQQVLLKLIAQQINNNQETISMNLSKISEANETVIRKILSGNSSIADVVLLGLNVRYRSLNTELHTENADLQAYALAVSTIQVEELVDMYDDVINNGMSVGAAFQKQMAKLLPDTKEVQLGKELHETFVIQTIGQTNYDKFLDIFKDLDLTTHLSAFTVLKAQASKIPVDHNTDGIPI